MKNLVLFALGLILSASSMSKAFAADAVCRNEAAKIAVGIAQGLGLPPVEATSVTLIRSFTPKSHGGGETGTQETIDVKIQPSTSETFSSAETNGVIRVKLVAFGDGCSFSSATLR